MRNAAMWMPAPLQRSLSYRNEQPTYFLFSLKGEKGEFFIKLKWPKRPTEFWKNEKHVKDFILEGQLWKSFEKIAKRLSKVENRTSAKNKEKEPKLSSGLECMKLIFNENTNERTIVHSISLCSTQTDSQKELQKCKGRRTFASTNLTFFHVETTKAIPSKFTLEHFLKEMKNTEIGSGEETKRCIQIVFACFVACLIYASDTQRTWKL